MIWIIVIYLIGVIATLILEYKVSKDVITGGELIEYFFLALFSWISFFSTLLSEISNKEFRIKNNKSNKFKMR